MGARERTDHTADYSMPSQCQAGQDSANGHIWRLGEVEEEATSEVTLGLTSVHLVLRAAILETFVAWAVGFFAEQ